MPALPDTGHLSIRAGFACTDRTPGDPTFANLTILPDEDYTLVLHRPDSPDTEAWETPACADDL